MLFCSADFAGVSAKRAGDQREVQHTSRATEETGLGLSNLSASNRSASVSTMLMQNGLVTMTSARVWPPNGLGSSHHPVIIKHLILGKTLLAFSISALPFASGKL